MDEDIQRAIRIIDDKIASLQDARNRLAAAFGIGGIPNSGAPTKPNPTGGVAITTNGHGNHAQFGNGQAVGRKEQLAKFLLEHGPMSRSDLYANAGIPEGTVSYCLNDKRFFEQDENGDWIITEFSRRGLERRHAGENNERA